MSQSSSGPVMQLLASGLKLWVRQQCEAVESLEIELEGSVLGLLRGRVAGVKLMARRVVYRKLRLELVDLTSSSIEVAMGALLKGNPLQLDHPFNISGQVSFSGDGLSRSLTEPHWQALSDQIGDALLGITPLVEVRIERDQLIFAAKAAGEPGLVELETELSTKEGTVEIRAIEGGAQLHLPLDPGIKIERASLEGGMVQLQGRALVSMGTPT